MDTRRPPTSSRTQSPRPHSQRQRSNSFPIIDALGCSTPEAQLILAEGRAAVRKRRARGRRNQSVNDENIPTFNPRHHIQFLDQLAALATPQDQTSPFASHSHHARMPSDATIGSNSTITAPSAADQSLANTSPTSPLGDYSANLALFIKAQLKSIPTYQPGTHPTSPRSCPDLSSLAPSPPQSPKRAMKRPAEAPTAIHIPPVRPPMRSAFSAWSSTDDDTDDEALPPSHAGSYSNDPVSKGTHYTPSVLGYYETSHNNSSFLFSSTPMEEESDPDTAKAFTFPDRSALPGSSSEPQDDDDYPSSCPSHPQLTTSSVPSVPSHTSPMSPSSYFECKRPTAITSHMKDRIIAAVTPPHPQTKTLAAISPWEGGALANVHDIFVESQQRVHVDGMSFDMLRDFTVPNRLTPC